jgi:hypothetical protein
MEMENSYKTVNVIKYDQEFILALKNSPLVSVPEGFDNSFIEIYTDKRKKIYRTDGTNVDDKNYMLPSPSLNDRSSIVLGPPKISFASSKQAIKTKFDDDQSRYIMSTRRVSKQNSDDRSKNMYRNRFQRNIRDRSDSFEHSNLLSPTNGQMHNHSYQNSNDKNWKYGQQKDKSFENEEETGQHSNNSLNGDNRKRNQFQQDKYNNMEEHKRNRERMMKFDKDKYSLRMPNNEMRDRIQNKREDGNRYPFKSPGLASAPVGKMDYHQYNRKDDIPEWMNYSPLDDPKLASNDKKKMDDFQIFKAKMNNRQGISSLSKPSSYNERESFFDEGIKKTSEKNMIDEIDKINNETMEKSRKLRNELNELQNKKEFFDVDPTGKMFNSVDQYFTHSLDNNNNNNKKPEQLPSIFTSNNGYPLDNPESKKSADSAVSGSKFSRFFSSSNDNVPETNINEVPPPPPHIPNFDLQAMQNSMQNPMVSASLLENSTSLLNNTNNINSSMQQTNLPPNLPPPPPGKFTNIPENNISNNSSSSNIDNNNSSNNNNSEESSIINNFISKYSIPPEKIVNRPAPPMPLPPQLPINLQQQMPNSNPMLNGMQPNELPINLANALQQQGLPQNISPINFNNQLPPFNQLPINLGNPMAQLKPVPSEKKIYSEEDILKSMGITKTETEESEKTTEQDKESMNRVMNLLAKSMNAKLTTNDTNKQGINPNETLKSSPPHTMYINSPSGPIPMTSEQVAELQQSQSSQQSKVNIDSRKQSESSIMSNKLSESSKSKKNSFSNNQSTAQILQNLVQHTIDSKLGGNIMNDNNKNEIDDDEIDEIEPSKQMNAKVEPMKNQTPVMEVNNMNINVNNLPFNQGNVNNPNGNTMNQLPMMGFGNNNMYDQFPMNKEEMVPPQFMQQRPPMPMVQGQNFMENSPQPNPNMFLQFNQNLPPQLQFPPQFQNEQQSLLHQGIYPRMMSNMASQPPQQQMLMENLMTRRSIPVSMMLSENIGNNPPQFITVEELERSQQMK